MLQAGDFFRDVLPVCDAYLLMEVIHDWADDEALPSSMSSAGPPRSTPGCCSSSR